MKVIVLLHFVDSPPMDGGTPGVVRHTPRSRVHVQLGPAHSETEGRTHGK